MDKAYLVREVKSFLMDEDGVGVIELVIELLKGEKDLNTIATENNIQPN